MIVLYRDGPQEEKLMSLSLICWCLITMAKFRSSLYSSSGVFSPRCLGGKLPGALHL